jgi:hypothetical protein
MLPISSSHSRPSPTSAFKPKRLLSRALMAAALLAGAGAALSAGSAQAQTNPCADGMCSWTEWTTDTDPTSGVTYGNFLEVDDKRFTFILNELTNLGDLASSSVKAMQAMSGDYIFKVDFATPDFTVSRFNFTYQAAIMDPHRFFKAVDLDSEADPLADPPSIIRAIYSGGNSPILLTSTNGSSQMENVNGYPIMLIVNNSYDGAGAIDAFENSFKQGQGHRVPGPVPVLGAGMAFGFSRKLRRRIQGRRVIS